MQKLASPARLASRAAHLEKRQTRPARRPYLRQSVSEVRAESGWKIDDAWPEKQGLLATLKGKSLQLDLSGEFRATVVSLRRA